MEAKTRKMDMLSGSIADKILFFAIPLAASSILQQLFNEDIGIANWGRRFAEREFLQTEQRLIPFLCTTASERYARLLEESPDMLQRLPLEHLASWLGITPVSLSRIRAKMKADDGQGQ